MRSSETWAERPIRWRTNCSLALVLQCAELVGVADRVFEMTSAYGLERQAFGRPILSFQALKHRIADMAVWLEGSKALTDALPRRSTT